VSLVDDHWLDGTLRLAGLLHELVDRCTDLHDFFVSELDGPNHGVFRNFLRSRLDHHDAFHRSDDHQGQRAFALLFLRRIHDELAIDLAYANGTDRPVEGNV